MIIDLINFDDLSDSFPRLYRTVSKAFGYTSGTYAVDISKLSDFTRGELSAWLRTQREKEPPAPQPVVEPAAPVAAQPAEPAEEQIDLAAYEREQLQKAADQARGLARMEQYAVEQGLERAPQNAAAIQQWLDENLKGYMSEKGVDVAVQWLGPKGSNVLTWIPKTIEPPPAPAEPEPAEVLAPLPNGEPRLPLDVPPTNKASKEQVKDWLVRTREVTGKYLRPRGSFGSSL